MDKQQIGNFVKEQREAQGLTQKALADKAQVRRQTVLDIENATLGYAVDKLLAVLDALGIAISFLRQTSPKSQELFIFRPKKKTNGKDG